MAAINGAHTHIPFSTPEYLKTSTEANSIKSRSNRLVYAGKMLFNGSEYIFSVIDTRFTKLKFEVFLQVNEQPAHIPAIYRNKIMLKIILF